MVVDGYRWVGLLTDEFDETVAFYMDVLGFALESLDEAKFVARFSLPSGQEFEVYGPRNRIRHAKYRAMEGPVVGLDVADVAEARREMIAQGIRFLTDVETNGDGVARAFFLGPGEQVYTIQSTSGAGSGRTSPG